MRPGRKFIRPFIGSLLVIIPLILLFAQCGKNQKKTGPLKPAGQNPDSLSSGSSSPNLPDPANRKSVQIAYKDIQAGERKALAAHLDKYQDFTWELKEILQPDINCDGIGDLTLQGIRKNADRSEYRLVTIIGPITDHSRVFSIRLFLNTPDRQDGFCGKKVKLSVQKVEKAFRYQYDAIPEGHLKSKNGKGCYLVTASHGCDPFHFYWNHFSNTLFWYRI